MAAVGYLRSPETDARELFLPTGCVLLTVNLGDEESRWYDDVRFTSPRRGASAMVVSAGTGAIGAELAHWSLTAGVAFRPGGAGPFLGLPASAIDRPVVALEDLWGRNGAVLRERLITAGTPQRILRTLEVALLERLARPPEPDRIVAHAASGLDGGLSVAHVVDRVGLSDRTFLRRFTEQVGVPPKRFARVRRLQRVLVRTTGAAPVDWGRVAADCGYFDQAHLINDFRRLTGVTPGAFPADLACPVNRLPISGGRFLQSPGAGRCHARDDVDRSGGGDDVDDEGPTAARRRGEG